MAPINSGIKRRHFLKALGTALVALAAPVAPAPTSLGVAHGPFVVPAGHSHAEDFARYGETVRTRLQVRYTRAQEDWMATPTRIDVLYGWAAVRPELATRLVSA